MGRLEGVKEMVSAYIHSSSVRYISNRRCTNPVTSATTTCYTFRGIQVRLLLTAMRKPVSRAHAEVKVVLTDEHKLYDLEYAEHCGPQSVTVMFTN